LSGKITLTAENADALVRNWIAAETPALPVLEGRAFRCGSNTISTADG